ncbi:MAG: response regulator [Planctomycetes bacterium]|nr:response regulator [Planctomycetota bacterium]
MSQPPRPAEILLVEDNEDDVVLTREGFRRARLQVQLHTVTNGRDCMAFLRREGAFAAAPSPDLVLLDLNLPVMDGRAVLAAVAADPSLCHVPIVVLTTSNHEQDILESYRLRCSSYITKPVDFQKFMGVIRELTDYWLTLVVLPPGRGPSPT